MNETAYPLTHGLRMVLTYTLTSFQHDIRSKQMTKKAIKDLSNKGTKASELNQKDLDKVSAGLAVIGGIARKSLSRIDEE
jgi:hypothetical protein